MLQDMHWLKTTINAFSLIMYSTTRTILAGITSNNWEITSGN